MVVFRKVGNLVNGTVGEVAKIGVKLVSKAVSNKNENVGQYIGEVGNTIIDASKGAIDNVAQFSDGAIRSGYGFLSKDEYHKQLGLYDLKDSLTKTIKGIGSSLKYVMKSTGITINAIWNNDRQQIAEGLKNLGKIAAVTTFAVGVIDVIDGADIVGAEGIETRNDHLLGIEHPDTGVPFETKTIELPNGDMVGGTFPIFESQFSVVLAEEVYLESDDIHFRIANETLYQSLEQDPSVTVHLGLTQTEGEALSQHETPEGYVWHHHEQPGVLQLIEEDVHQQTGHTGGREIWGGGDTYR